MSKNLQIIMVGAVVVTGLILSLILLNKHQNDILQFHSHSDNMMMIPKEIRYYDEVMTMSANMAAFTHKKIWEERYQDASKKLDDAIFNAIKLFPNITEYLNKIDSVNQTLITLEKKAFELVNSHKYSEAQAILLSDKYTHLKQLYSKNLNELILNIESSIYNYEKQTQNKFVFLVSLITFVVALTLLLGVFLITIFRKQSKDLQHSNESFQNQYKLLQKIIDTVPVRMFWKDKAGTYLGANQLFLHDTKLGSLSDIIGKNDFEMPWAKTEAQAYRDDDISIMLNDVPLLQFEESQTDKNGNVITLLTSKIPLKDIYGNTVGILGVYDDISARKKLEKETKEHEVQLIQQSRHAQMGEMISMIAHQWRQPLASISATVGSMQVKQALGIKDDDYAKQLQNINDYTIYLSKTIEDFREFLKEEKNAARTTLKTVLEDSIKIIKPTFDMHQIKISIHIESDEDILTYPNELKQVVINLLKNAQEVLNERDIKDKKINVNIYKNDQNNCLEVIDNAGGIPSDILDKIFEPYFTTKGLLNGTGLGLYMSKKIIQEHCAGRLSVTNKDVGASFIIELPKNI